MSDLLTTSTVIPDRLRKHAWRRSGIIDAHLTGSCLVQSTDAKDIDYCILFEDDAAAVSFVRECGGTVKEYQSAGEFITAREGLYNYICTSDSELYWRTVAFSGALELLQLERKEDRVALAKACMDYMPKMVAGIAI